MQQFDVVCHNCIVTVSETVDPSRPFTLACPLCNADLYSHIPQPVRVPATLNVEMGCIPDDGVVERGLWKPGERDEARRLLNW